MVSKFWARIKGSRNLAGAIGVRALRQAQALSLPKRLSAECGEQNQKMNLLFTRRYG